MPEILPEWIIEFLPAAPVHVLSPEALISPAFDQTSVVFDFDDIEPLSDSRHEIDLIRRTIRAKNAEILQIWQAMAPQYASGLRFAALANYSRPQKTPSDGQERIRSE